MKMGRNLCNIIVLHGVYEIHCNGPINFYLQAELLRQNVSSRTQEIENF